MHAIAARNSALRAAAKRGFENRCAPAKAPVRELQIALSEWRKFAVIPSFRPLGPGFAGANPLKAGG